MTSLLNHFSIAILFISSQNYWVVLFTDNTRQKNTQNLCSTAIFLNP